MVHNPVLPLSGESHTALEVLLFINFAVLVLWKTWVFFPMRLTAVMFHELSHASCAFMCCATVTSIEVEANEGGVTHYTYGSNRGWIRWFVIPAGYLGSSVVGCAFIIASALSLSSLVATGTVAVIMLVSVCVLRTKIIFALATAFVIFTAILWALALTNVDENAIGLRLFTAVVGTSSALYAAFDIYDDTVRRAVDGSDSKSCASLCGCSESDTASRAIGTAWMLFSFAFYLVAVTLHVVIVEWHGSSHSGAAASSSAHHVLDVYGAEVPVWLFAVVPVAVFFLCICTCAGIMAARNKSKNKGSSSGNVASPSAPAAAASSAPKRTVRGRPPAPARRASSSRRRTAAPRRGSR